MTRRERLERKLEKREEWAAGRRSKAAALLQRNEPYRGDVAFNTQPGHIPERARAIARSEKACEHHQVAAHHENAAAGLARQLETSIYSDDPDAVAQLEARAAALDAEADQENAINKAWKKGKGAPGWADGLGLEADAIAKLERTMQLCPYLKGPCFAGNTRANARRLRERIKTVRARQERTAAAEAAPGGVVIEGAGEYVSVTFAEKPERDVLDALKAAGFAWGSGSWHGRRDHLPAAVAS